MRTIKLEDDAFAATFASPMQSVSGKVGMDDIWSYVDAIPRGEIGLLEPLHRSVDVYRSGDARFHHFLVPTSGSNVYLVVVTGDAVSSILGHHFLDLNEKYGLKAPPLVDAWRTSPELCSRYKAEPDSPMSTDQVGIALDTVHLDPLNGLRSQSAGTTSGWYIWGGDSLSPDPEFFQPLHVSHLAERCPAALSYLALPAGWRFLLGENGHVDIWYDEQLLERATT